MSDLFGQSIGLYHSLEQVGEGGMEGVYKIYENPPGQDVASQNIRRGAFPPRQLERILKRFEPEAPALLTQARQLDPDYYDSKRWEVE